MRRWVGRPKVWYLVNRVAERLSCSGVAHGPELLRELVRVQQPRGQLPWGLVGSGGAGGLVGTAHADSGPGRVYGAFYQ